MTAFSNQSVDLIFLQYGDARNAAGESIQESMDPNQTLPKSFSDADRMNQKNGTTAVKRLPSQLWRVEFF